jgi:hypothetical protein
MKIRTDYPIANCHLEHAFNEMGKRDHLIAYLIDIFGHLYTFNLSVYFEHHQKLPMPQPVRYTLLHQPTPYALINDQSKLHHEVPLLLTKLKHVLTSVNLGGSLKIYDLKKAKANDKSWLVNVMPVEPETHQFKHLCLAATTSAAKSTLGHVVVLVLNNRQPPYPFIDCTSASEYKLKTMLLENFYTEGEDETS